MTLLDALAVIAAMKEWNIGENWRMPADMALYDDATNIVRQYSQRVIREGRHGTGAVLARVVAPGPKNAVSDAPGAIEGQSE